MPFIPLEANPDVFHPLAGELGLPLDKYQLHDVYGLDDELLAMVPRPVSAVIMLFPSPPRWNDPKRVAEDAEALKRHPISDRKGIVYFRQKISNACGTFVSVRSSVPRLC